MSWQETLNAVVMISSIHGKFLNTLSLMEYIGARKILKSQREQDIRPTVLAHMSEEIRHAQVFKRLALKINPSLITYGEEHLVAGVQARGYMQDMDRGVESCLGTGRPWENYLLSTLIIEERANKIYPLYADYLKPLGLDGPLRTIMREEENHLAEISDSLLAHTPLAPPQLQVLRQLEEQSFSAFVAEIQREINQAKTSDSVVFTH